MKMRTTGKKSKKAFALLSVLGLMTVLTLMLGALMANNQSAFHLLKQGQAQDRVARTENSVFAFCRMKLENDFTWGRDPFQGSVVELGHLTVKEVSSSGGDTQKLSGRDAANQIDFEVEIVNNLVGEVTLIDELNEGRKNGVSKGYCRLRIHCKTDTKQHSVEIVTRNPGLISAGLLSNGEMSVNAERFGMYTKDPMKNQVRSLSDIYLNGMGDLFFDPVSANPPNGATAQDPVVWAAGDTRFRDSGSGEWKNSVDFDASTTQDLRLEKFREQAQATFQVPDVDFEELAAVTGPNDEVKEVKSLPSGIYEFQQMTINDSVVRVLARRQSVSGEAMASSQGPIERFWYFSEEDGSSPSYPSPEFIASRISASPGTFGTNHKGEQRVDIGGPAHANSGATVDLLNRNIVLDEQYNYEVDGDFGIRAKPIFGDIRYDAKMSLIFANPSRIASEGTVSTDDVTTAAERATWRHGDLRSTSGRIHIEGDIAGSATLAAAGDVNLELSRFNDRTGNAAVNFSIYSGGDVTLKPPLLTTDPRVGEKYVSQPEITMTGLIYARGKVDLDLGQYRDLPENRVFNIEGAIVAGNGDLNITNVKELNLVYNPQFVDRILPGLFKDNQRRIEVASWRPL